ncbi:hypothetical protein EVJ58_g1594 [Rhodofomes roseus]|uniref:EamA domain-containing protein n=1 Tax=Rhodofomes roseus TaxID=34475 RepID=A0A4Y9Z0Q1_9APHY|nr:hypothetical protein EVJ58_g1594 [Rhodofomes roseus]
MTSTTSRTPYDAQTPDRTTFGSDVPLARFDTSEVDAALRRPSFYLDSSFNAKWKKFVSKCKTTCKTTYKNNIGLLLIAASTAFGSLMSTLVKKLNSVDPPVPMLEYLSISDATVLQFLAPMCTGIVGALVLKEHFTRSQALASFFSLVGVVLIARPRFLFGHIANNSDTALDPPVVLDGRSDYEEVLPAQRLRAVGFAMFGVVGATGAYTTIRAIGKRAHALHSVTAFSMQCITVSSILMVVFRTTPILPNKLEWVGMLLAIGFCGFFAQMLLTLGLQRETAGRGTMAIYVQIIFATINDIVFFHSTPNLLSTIGTTIIIASAIYVATSKKDPGLHKRQQSLISSPADHSLEEGLLENEEDSAEPSESKDEVSASVITVKSPDPSHEGKCNGKAGTLPS